jgi:methyltransferase (TIGR00027 family)
MKNEQAPITYTAYRVVFHIALEQFQPEEQRLIHDDLARWMLPGQLKLLLSIFSFKPLREGFLALIERGFPGARGGLCRKRYIDDRLIEALNDGVEVVVILGSGLDTRAYRFPELKSLVVYEVDLPQTIAYKETKLKQLYGAVPSHVRLIPMDFNRQALEDTLKSKGYSPDRKSFFIWEGVTQYISESAVRKVFEFLAKAKPGSRMVFTYIKKDFVDGVKTYGLERLYQQTRSMWRFGLQPSQVAAFIGEYHWNELEEAGADEYRQRYLNPIGRTESVMEIERMVYAEKSETY